MKTAMALFVLLLLCENKCYSQKEYNMWYFGENAGLDFNNDSVKTFYDPSFSTYESSTSMCDTNGNLLFYTNGNKVYNKLHELMNNGSIKGRHYSAVQGSMALKVPGSDFLYYVLLSSESEAHRNNYIDSLRYIIIDMQLDSGRGMVITDELPLLPRSLESFAVTKHANGIDYWIAAPEHDRKHFNCIRTVNSGFSNSFVVNDIPNGDSNFISASKFSPNSKIVMTNFIKKRDLSNYSVTGSFNLYHFDNATGKISDGINIPLGKCSGITSLEFSPNSKYLYTLQIDSITKYPFLLQYDLSIWNAKSIINSKKSFGRFYSENVGMQIGSDGRFYVFGSMSQMIFIEFPNLPYPQCIGNDSIIKLKFPSKNKYGHPYYPNFYFREPNIQLKKVQFFCDYDSLVLHAEISGEDSFQWEGSSKINSDLIVYKSGVYYLKVYCNKKVFYDSVVVVDKPKPSYSLDSLNALCNLPLRLEFKGNAESLLWNNGSTDNVTYVSDTGYYKLHINIQGCVFNEQIHVIPCENISCFIPNAFSPDENAINDSFKLNCTFINAYHLKIYNSWGELMFECDDLNCAWDGYYKGKPCPQGIYMVIGEVNGMLNNKPHTYQIKKAVHLMR